MKLKFIKFTKVFDRFIYYQQDASGLCLETGSGKYKEDSI